MRTRYAPIAIATRKHCFVWHFYYIALTLGSLWLFFFLLLLISLFLSFFLFALSIFRVYLLAQFVCCTHKCWHTHSKLLIAFHCHRTFCISTMHTTKVRNEEWNTNKPLKVEQSLATYSAINSAISSCNANRVEKEKKIALNNLCKCNFYILVHSFMHTTLCFSCSLPFSVALVLFYVLSRQICQWARPKLVLGDCIVN